MSEYSFEYTPLDLNRDGKISNEELSDPRNTASRSELVEDFVNNNQYVDTEAAQKNKKINRVATARYQAMADFYAPNGVVAEIPGITFSREENQLNILRRGQPTAAAFIAWSKGAMPEASLIGKGQDQILKTYGADKVFKALEKVYPELKGTGFGGTSYTAALSEVLNNYSMAQYFAVIRSPEGSTKETETFLEFLNGLSAGEGAGGGPTYDVNITGRETAWQNYKATARDLLGINPTKADFEDYLKKLNAKERQFVSMTSTSGNTTTTRNEQFDPTQFTLNHILERANLSGDLKGAAGQYQNWLNQTAKAFGLEGKLDSRAVGNQLKNLLTGKRKQEDIQDSFRKRAKLLYGAFAEDIDENPELTLAEIMETYIGQYANTFEVGDNEIDIADVAKFATAPDGKKLSTWDFQKQLRGDKRFGYTKQANKEATDMALSFARAFGVNV
jgi:hypothetical protein